MKLAKTHDKREIKNTHKNINKYNADVEESEGVAVRGKSKAMSNRRTQTESYE